jgi:CBS-domain-containing membrane protein
MIDKPDKVEERFHMLVRIVGNWGASDRPALAGIIWMAVLLGILLWLDDQHEGIFLVPPFAATMSMLLYLPSVPVAQPFAIVCGSVFAAAIGTALSMFLGFGPGVALVAALTALVLLPLLRAFHPPAIALAMIPALLHPGPWFALRVVLPFTLAAVISCAVMCRLLSSWPRYPVPLRTESGRI